MELLLLTSLASLWTQKSVSVQQLSDEAQGKMLKVKSLGTPMAMFSPGTTQK